MTYVGQQHHHLSGARSCKAYTDGSYANQNPSWHKEDGAWKAKQIAKMMNRHNLWPESVCEIGCGVGEILSTLNDIFPECKFDGFDVSSDAINAATLPKHTGIRLFEGTVSDVLDYYDLLLCIDVVEHIDDYIGFLTQLNKISSYQIFHFPLDLSCSSVLRGTLLNARASVRHLHYFSSDTVLATLQDCGFEIIDSFHTLPFLELSSRRWKSRLARIPRTILSWASPRWTERLLGGCSFLVLCKSNTRPDH